VGLSVRVAEPPSPDLAALVARVGAVEAADRIRCGAVGGELARLTVARREIDCAAADLDVLARLGGRLIVADDADWPLTSFRSFRGVDSRTRPQAHPPLVLWAVGTDGRSPVLVLPGELRMPGKKPRNTPPAQTNPKMGLVHHRKRNP
jgi:DNA processing protein